VNLAKTAHHFWPLSFVMVLSGCWSAEDPKSRPDLRINIQKAVLTECSSTNGVNLCQGLELSYTITNEGAYKACIPRLYTKGDTGLDGLKVTSEDGHITYEPAIAGSQGLIYADGGMISPLLFKSAHSLSPKQSISHHIQSRGRNILEAGHNYKFRFRLVANACGDESLPVAFETAGRLNG